MSKNFIYNQKYRMLQANSKLNNNTFAGLIEHNDRFNHSRILRDLKKVRPKTFYKYVESIYENTQRLNKLCETILKEKENENEAVKKS